MTWLFLGNLSWYLKRVECLARHLDGVLTVNSVPDVLWCVWMADQLGVVQGLFIVTVIRCIIGVYWTLRGCKCKRSGSFIRAGWIYTCGSPGQPPIVEANRTLEY